MPLLHRCLFILIILLTAAVHPAIAQSDTTTHGWPVAPFFGTHPITGTFCEFRNTLSSDHWHNGVDVPMPDGTPVYPVYNGTVTGIGTTASSGSNAYVRVQYIVSGLVKSDAYVHIDPNPALRVGDPVVAYTTVLGTILPGLGHVHFTHGLSGAEMNAIRSAGGFTPYIDIYPPRILSVRFLQDGKETEFLNGRVSGRVDIRVHMVETNASRPADVSTSTSNNGIYVAGYRILSADRQTVFYEPPSGGVRYRFDRKPYDADVHSAFAAGSDLSTPIYTLTNGNGADAINATRSVPNGFWDTESLPVGPYTVMIFAGDTRGLADTVYLPVTVERGDLVAPAAPVLRSVRNDSTNRVTVSWFPNSEQDLQGYRLFYSVDGTSWTLRDGEQKLAPGVTSVSYDNIRSGRIFFRLAAVDTASPLNVSPFSDVYGLRLNSSASRTLIVDGFDRTEGSGSYHDVSHPFAMTHGLSMTGDFETCANEAVVGGGVVLADYARVVWLLGDESTVDETFSAAEQALVIAYLRQGGRLFVSGSELAYDLGRASGPTDADREFLATFLKVSYAADDANEYTVAGAPGTPFASLLLRYGRLGEGSPYDEDWPDVLGLAGGAEPLLFYHVNGTGGVACAGYRGVFDGGTREGGVVTMGFPFETIVNKGVRDTLMMQVFIYLGAVTPAAVDPWYPMVPDRYALLQNFPNPFNPSTVIRFVLPALSRVRLSVFDLLGREVALVLDEERAAGEHSITFDAAGLASGVYFYRMVAGPFTGVRQMMVLQ